uniref:Zgc:112185 n=2 Tax=Cyclopterus lumpus TaxID=8103 RepID=A0A8C2Z435_CYCLU
METTETQDISSPSSQHCVPEEKPSLLQEINSPPEPSVQSKAKKKKNKSGKKNLSDSAAAQQTPSSAEGSQGGEEAELSAEEQLNRQLDWCIEQLESGMGSQKGTPKQKEEASRSLKTLRSSKAPLAKKRQVMRAMTGDYRKKMDEEKSKQYKLIQNEIASAKVKVVSNSPKKSSFHRRAEVKKQTPATEEDLDAAQDTDLKTQTQEETPAFVFTSSKEEFHFNFL